MNKPMRIKRLTELIDTEMLNIDRIVEDIPISKIIYDSRKAGETSLFVAIRGFATDGHRYLKDVMKLGAAAAVVEKPDKKIDLSQYCVPDSRLALARLASRFYHPELERMRIVGITGTNGKTTTSYLVKSILDAAALNCGLIGTVHYNIGGHLTPAWNTTPESVDLFDMIYQMHIQGQKSCVLEASSHGLALHRLDYLNMDVAVFTNLSQDHLDFHKNFEDYFQAKKRLFYHLKPEGIAVINRDDPYGQRFIKEITRQVIDFGLSPDADVGVIYWHSSMQGINAEIKYPGGTIKLHSPLIGKFNVENLLAAFAAGLAMNIDAEVIKSGIEAVSSIPGRLEPASVTREGAVIIDYSHTPDALHKALKVLKELTKQKLWVVFGCGGDRDKQKRPLMGQAAEKYADNIILTSDNPRSEEPDEIIRQIYRGINQKEPVIIEPDRRKAISLALNQADSKDLILIAGKGHENYQEIKGKKHPFDDKAIVEELAG